MRFTAGVLIAFCLSALSPAQAWGELGHRITALIAYRHLTPRARTALDTLLAGDPDRLTAPDFASRTSWADRYRDGRRETAAWHYVNIEIDDPDLPTACFGFPPLAAGQAASQGPAQDCIVNKIDQFLAELEDPRTPPSERLLAFKFFIHFIGDLHQPLHAADHADRGGNCIYVLPITGTAATTATAVATDTALGAPAGSPAGAHARNLHAFWDIDAVAALGTSAEQIADRLDAAITIEQARTWSVGAPRTWALESFGIAKRDAYLLPALPTCRNPSALALSAAYRAAAAKDAAEQISKAGIRMAAALNAAFEPVSVH